MASSQWANNDSSITRSGETQAPGLRRLPEGTARSGIDSSGSARARPPRPPAKRDASQPRHWRQTRARENR
eukprot:1029727-Pyramimonas_sp.AAC.1